MLELDGFNAELNIAFEYQGIQHYKVDGFFIKTKEQLHKRKNDDLLKQKLCFENGVKLIIIPYFKNISDVQNIICDLNCILYKNGFETQENIHIDLYKLNYDKMYKYKKLAMNRGGECLSTVYINYNTKLTWRCSLGHIWEAIGYSIERGHWCPRCSNSNKHIKHLPII